MRSQIEIWRSFERWAARFVKLSLAAGSGLHVWKFSELLQGQPLTQEEIRRRACEKIGFLTSYFVEISYDGAEFMEKLGASALAHQNPSRCNNAFGIWLV